MSNVAQAQPSEGTASSVAYAIDIVGLAKRFRRHTIRSRYTTLKSAFLGLFRRGDQRTGPLTVAVKDVTLRIPRGLSVGIIGRNGSGKSTLLKLITGIYRPDAGRVAVNGRVAALIELGAGFHPDFSGRENVMLGGMMHGLTRREIEERFDAIVDFAELREVIDDPVRTYSSGMFMRLGFSLAVHVDPDVLLVDEVLAVGDAGFVAKCKDRIAEMRKRGKTLLLVTHDLEAVERWSDEVLWMHQGEVRDRGDPRRVIDHYREFIERGEEQALHRDAEVAGERHRAADALSHDGETEPSATAHQGATTREEAPARARWGSREVEITGVKISGPSAADQLLFHPEDSLCVEVAFRFNERVPTPVFGIGIHRSDGLVIHGSNTHIERVELGPLGTSGAVIYEVSRLGLLEGRYRLDVAVHREDGYPYDYQQGAVEFVVRSSCAQIGVVVPAHQWRLQVQ